MSSHRITRRQGQYLDRNTGPCSPATQHEQDASNPVALVKPRLRGTYTPICLLALPGSPGEQLLVTVWAGALIGVAQSLFWVTAPKSLVTVLYLLLGWAGVKSVGQLRDTSVLLVACGGAAYTLGAIVYAMKRPNPVPKTFGKTSARN
ncbi:hypothetical protein WJX77_000974 [Trebouxia sp. C0004]